MVPTSEPRRRSDGEATHATILEAAMRLASIEGLGSLTIGRLARELDITKSGVFAHFRSKQRLQQETIEATEENFAREVVEPALAAPEGRARVEALCESYLSYVERGVFPGGCLFAQLLAEFDGPPGEIHDHVVVGQRGWLRMLAELVSTAQCHGEFDPDLEPEQLAFFALRPPRARQLSLHPPQGPVPARPRAPRRDVDARRVRAASPAVLTRRLRLTAIPRLGDAVRTLTGRGRPLAAG